MGDFGDKLASIITGVIGLAILAVVLSTKSQTTQVLSSLFSGLGTLVGAAVSPVTGGTSSSGVPTIGSLTGN